MARYDVYIVGCGGVGGHLVSLLPQTMACLMVDKAGPDQRERMLSSEGLDIPAGINPFRRLVLIDGDRFSGHNALRQAAVAGSKLEVQMTRIRHSDVFSTWLNDTHLEGYDLYLTPENTDKVFEDTTNCVVFMGVDNHKTRYELSRYLRPTIRHTGYCSLMGVMKRRPAMSPFGSAVMERTMTLLCINCTRM